MTVRVIGGGLAGCEAALTLSSRGVDVELIEIKPDAYTPAHHSPDFAELVCSNSLKSNTPPDPSWLLKQEMKALGSALIPIAESVAVPAGSALGVDRVLFSRAVTDAVRSRKNITVVTREYRVPDDSMPTVIATGPLTTPELAESVARSVGREYLGFFDAASPIVDAATIDFSRVFSGSRYGKGGGDYINCPMNKTEYGAFVRELVAAETAELRDFENKEVFEGCMPVEIMARRGPETLRCGPMNPKGLSDCYAVVQLRTENREVTGYNVVGFQTNLKIGEQHRVFRMIPGLERAEFFRYGVMHRNTYLDCPRTLDKTMRLNGYKQVYVAGQLSGVEGYVESMASGLAVALYLERRLAGKEVELLPRTTLIGALLGAITIAVGNFQPINANFGLLPPMKGTFSGKPVKFAAYADRALADLGNYINRFFQEKTVF